MQARAFVPNKYYLSIYKRNLISDADAIVILRVFGIYSASITIF